MKSGSLTHSGMPPEYGTQAYWDHRFASDAQPFDWLLPADCLDSAVRSVLSSFPSFVSSSYSSSSSDPSAPAAPSRNGAKSSGEQPHLPRILHIGCGTSQTSYRLRSLVSQPSQVTNMDYSPAAIQQCIRREKELFGRPDEVASREKGGMQWEVADLLSASDISDLGRKGGEDGVFDVIVDKSTCDAIACTDDVQIGIPYENLDVRCRSTNAHDHEKGEEEQQDHLTGPKSESQKQSIHPLHLLSVHLAAITRPQSGRWVILSYSDDRFPFLEKSRSADAEGVVYQAVLDRGFPDPRKLWRLERKERLTPKTEKLVEKREGGVVYKPEVAYWLYVLARTDVEL